MVSLTWFLCVLLYALTSNLAWSSSGARVHNVSVDPWSVPATPPPPPLLFAWLLLLPAVSASVATATTAAMSGRRRCRRRARVSIMARSPSVAPAAACPVVVFEICFVAGTGATLPKGSHGAAESLWDKKSLSNQCLGSGYLSCPEKVFLKYD